MLVGFYSSLRQVNFSTDLSHFADPSLMDSENMAFEEAMVEKHAHHDPLTQSDVE